MRIYKSSPDYYPKRQATREPSPTVVNGQGRAGYGGFPSESTTMIPACSRLFPPVPAADTLSRNPQAAARQAAWQRVRGDGGEGGHRVKSGACSGADPRAPTHVYFGCVGPAVSASVPFASISTTSAVRRRKAVVCVRLALFGRPTWLQSRVCVRFCQLDLLLAYRRPCA
jgi:hypothetical protein